MEIAMTIPLYTEELVKLAHRAARFGMFIDLVEPNVDDAGECAGPFALRHAHFGDGDGYDVHLPGVNLELLTEQIKQIEGEKDWTRCQACGSIIKPCDDEPDDEWLSDCWDCGRSDQPLDASGLCPTCQKSWPPNPSFETSGAQSQRTRHDPSRVGDFSTPAQQTRAGMGPVPGK
jgi:hypothetical protein